MAKGHAGLDHHPGILARRQGDPAEGGGAKEEVSRGSREAGHGHHLGHSVHHHANLIHRHPVRCIEGDRDRDGARRPGYQTAWTHAIDRHIQHGPRGSHGRAAAEGGQQGVKRRLGQGGPDLEVGAGQTHGRVKAEPRGGKPESLGESGRCLLAQQGEPVGPDGLELREPGSGIRRITALRPDQFQGVEIALALAQRYGPGQGPPGVYTGSERNCRIEPAHREEPLGAPRPVDDGVGPLGLGDEIRQSPTLGGTRPTFAVAGGSRGEQRRRETVDQGRAAGADHEGIVADGSPLGISDRKVFDLRPELGLQRGGIRQFVFFGTGHRLHTFSQGRAEHFAGVQAAGSGLGGARNVETRPARWQGRGAGHEVMGRILLSIEGLHRQHVQMGQRATGAVGQIIPWSEEGRGCPA